ncbi:MAG: nitrous oxide reductase family maturation protein NosD [Promethearchaeota archaeon]
MKSKVNFIIVLLSIVLTGIILLSCSNLILNPSNEENYRIDDESYNVKIAISWNLDFIHVDGNWSATTNFEWCNGNGSWSNPYVIENVTIDASSSPTGYGIYIVNSKIDYFIIRNCTVYNAGGGAGIRLESTCNGTLSGNTCTSNGRGIWLFSNCHNNTISENTANGNGGVGIILENNCNNNTISENIACGPSQDRGIRLLNGCERNIISKNIANENNDYGIYVYINCDENTILGNTASDNLQNGIYLLRDCDNNTLSGNTLSGNSQDGLSLLEDCNNNTIMENLVSSNSVGIELQSCRYNLIFLNFCFNNSGSNAYNTQFYPNDWDNGVIGNAWDDYSGTDANNDGIGDTPYSIPPQVNIKDNKPLMKNIIYFLNTPDDLTYEIGKKGHFINWTVINTAFRSLLFNIFQDGTSIRTGNLLPTINRINVNIDHLDVGTHGLTLEVYNEYGRRFTDGVWITVTNIAPVFTMIPSGISYVVGEMGNTLSWTFTDESTNNPTYTITRDSVPIIVGEPCNSGEVISVSVDELELGVHGFSIEVNDGYGGTLLGGIWVTVTNIAPVFTLIPSDISYVVGEMGNTLSWTFIDESTNNPTYTITQDGVPIIVGESCNSGEVISVSVDGLEVGLHGFSIEINDGYGRTVLGGVWVRVYTATNPNPISNGIDILTPSLIVVGSIAAISTTGLVISMTKKRRIKLK